MTDNLEIAVSNFEKLLQVNAALDRLIAERDGLLAEVERLERRGTEFRDWLAEAMRERDVAQAALRDAQQEVERLTTEGINCRTLHEYAQMDAERFEKFYLETLKERNVAEAALRTTRETLADLVAGIDRCAPTMNADRWNAINHGSPQLTAEQTFVAELERARRVLDDTKISVDIDTERD